MSISSSLKVFSCVTCDWQHVALPIDDFRLSAFSWFSICPKCGNQEIALRPANRVEILKARLDEFFENEKRR